MDDRLLENAVYFVDGSAVVVRPMRLTDVRAVAELEAQTFTSPWSEEAFVGEINEPEAGAYVAQVDGMIAAYLVFRIFAQEMHILNIAVHEQFRRRGLAEFMLRTFMERAAQSGVINALLEVRESNVAARRLYEKLGFSVVGRRARYYVEPVEDALLMACHL